MTVWVLCVLLDRESNIPAICTPQPNEQLCGIALRDWLYRAWAWEDRSGVLGKAVAFCDPPEVST